MNITDVTKEILYEVQRELHTEKGIELSIQEIAEIAESQFLGLTFGIKRGIDVRLPLFGSFLRKFGYEKGMAGIELNKLKKFMSDDEYNRKVLEAKIRNKRATQLRRKALVFLDIDKLKKTKPIVNTKHRYDG